MTINNIWVFAQGANGAATTGTLELLTKARSLSSKVTAFVGGDASGFAASRDSACAKYELIDMGEWFPLPQK